MVSDHLHAAQASNQKLPNFMDIHAAHPTLRKQLLADVRGGDQKSRQIIDMQVGPECEASRTPHPARPGQLTTEHAALDIGQ